MRHLSIAFIFFLHLTLTAQVGIGTTSPEGALDVSTASDSGLVLPRVSGVANVTNPSGAPIADGTMVFDISLGMPCVYTNGKWACFGFDSSGTPVVVDGTPVPFPQQLYFKASTNGVADQFGNSVALSQDGLTMAISAPREDSNATGINGDETNDLSFSSGAVYIFAFNSGSWAQQAFIKASNSGTNDFFSRSISLSDNGNVLAVSASLEDSNATGINGDQTNNSTSNSGAVYIFERTGSTWVQSTYIKASNTDANDNFGYHLDLSGDGNYLVVGAQRERSNATGVNGDQTDNSFGNAGAAYVFFNSAGTWLQQAYLKSSNTDAGDEFGEYVAIDEDGDTIVVTASGERSNATGINGNQANNSVSQAGAAYVFTRSGTSWSQEAYIKASNTESDLFGSSLDISNDGNTFAIGAYQEDSSATGIDGNQADNSANSAGAVYVFSRVAGVWSQDAYIKASNTEATDNFGFAGLALSGDGTTLVVGAFGEDSNAVGVNGDESNNDLSSAGAVYVYKNTSGSWVRDAYIKATNTDAGDGFGSYLNIPGYSPISINMDGSIIVSGACYEDSNASGIGGDQANNTSADSGAVYLFEN